VTIVLATALPWISLGVLAALLVGLIAGAFLLLAMGRMHLDLGWGRSIHPLGPITVAIDAPREIVFEIIAAPYLGRVRVPEIDVLARDRRLAVAAHHTKVHFYTARTVEVIELEPPSRVGFRHITGPVPHAVEEFVLTGDGDRSELRYSGEIGIDFFILGRVAGRRWVRPQWEATVREHLDDVKERAERRSGPR
jgi:uncharacterized protein YndB with AHSA1/START domain